MTVSGDSHLRDQVVVLDGVRKQFGDFVAVEHADLAIGRGEFFSLLGPSGCGKTTLLRLVAGFERPTAGRVLLEGVDVTTVPPHRRNVNTVFQQYALFPHMSVLDNVAFGLRSKKVPAAEARRRALEMLDVVGLAEFAARRTPQLSGGQQQRVALARALVNLPAALLLDEPLAALDLKLREAMQIELKRIQREVGITFVFVTHDQGEALTLSDRIAVMGRGRIEQVGTPTEIYEAPSSIFVAGFIGSANLLPGRLEGAAAGAPVAVLDAGGRIALPAAGDARDGDPITVMLRPERIQIVPGSPGEADGRSLPAVVKDVIFQGASLRVIVDAPGETEMLVTVEVDDGTPDVRPGDDVTLRWTPDAAYLLRGRSGIIGATTTDVDEVQATMEGKEVGEEAATPATTEPPAPRVSRRTVLVGGGVAAAAALGAVLLSGIGRSGGASDEPVGGDEDALVGGGLGQGDRELNILNWTEYIDPTEDGEVGTVDRFEAETGIRVNYSETLNDNMEAYGREFAAYLEAGNPTPWDIAVPSDWMAARLKARGWLAPLPFHLIPNYVNLDPQYLDLRWDRGAKYHLPWQAGITGIAYNRAVTGRELRSINDLLSPELAGQVAFFTEMHDTLGLLMLAQGNDPAIADEAALEEALDLVERLTRDGHVRRFTGNDYLNDIQNGNFAACMAWSGDIAQVANPDVHFVVPEEGAISWFDTMVIPIGAANGVAAARWMNYVYDPEVAARITAYVQYVPTVLGVREELIRMGGEAAELAESPLLFPDDEAKARMHPFADLPPELEQRITDRFVGIIGG